MANPAKQKGTDGENKVRDFFRGRGYVHADRLAQSGALDRGDITLGDGIDFAIEVKAGQGALRNPHSHLRELKAEIVNAGAFAGAVIAKKPGSTNVGEDWVAMMPVRVLADMLDRLYPGNTEEVPSEIVGDDLDRFIAEESTRDPEFRAHMEVIEADRVRHNLRMIRQHLDHLETDLT